MTLSNWLPKAAEADNDDSDAESEDLRAARRRIKLPEQENRIVVAAIEMAVTRRGGTVAGCSAGRPSIVSNRAGPRLSARRSLIT